MRPHKLPPLLLIVVLTVLSASADVIYDNGGYIPGAVSSDFDFQQAADDFILNAGRNTITDIHWWGEYFPADTPQPLDNFTILIFADDGGAPGATAVLDLNIGDVGRAVTGDNNNGIEIYSYSVDISPLTLASGTRYWLSILNDTRGDADDDWYWSISSGARTGAFRLEAGQGEWRTGAALAFRLTNDGIISPIPEPTSITLLGVGLARLALRMRRRKC